MKAFPVLEVRRAALAGALALLATTGLASSAVLTLTDVSSVPVPPGTHADAYELPSELFTPGKPIATLEVDYVNSPFVPGIGIHEIQSATFLFQASDLASMTVLESTVDRFWVLIVFSTTPADRRPTGLTNPGAPALVAVHGNFGTGSVTTGAAWTATYSDGSTRTAYNGIIPEPSTVTIALLSAGLALTRRTRTRARSDR